MDLEFGKYLNSRLPNPKIKQINEEEAEEDQLVGNVR